MVFLCWSQSIGNTNSHRRGQFLRQSLRVGQQLSDAIARALLKRPKILIFDEATSGLDADTAAQFARTVNQLRGSITIVFIAHVLPPGLAAGRVYRIGEVDQPPGYARADVS